MFKETNKPTLLLLLIFAFSFIYRLILMTWAIYPSGADIGLHNSVIHSITQGGNTDFLYNFYQMGGGLSLTFPGYHIVVAQIMLMTGIPEYLVHALVVSLASSVIVLISYLITRSVWRESAALVVAFLVAISRFDIEMLLWGGYPNVITLLLIPLTFYLFIQKNRFSKVPFYVSTSLLAGSIFLTHSLSTFVFVSIVLVMVVLGLIFAKKIGTTRLEALSWLIPLVIGAIIVSPYLIQIVPAYLSNQTVADINEATVSTRILPLEIILPLFAVVGLFFLLSKKYHKRFFTVPTVLLVMWILVPVIFTQGYLVGQYTDYNRFLYFVIMPVFILIGLFIDHGSGFFARIIVTYRTLNSQLNNGANKTKEVTHKRLAKLSAKISRNLTRKNLYAAFIISFLMVCFALIPIFMTPEQGVRVQEFYQAMNKPLYEAMQWAKANTPSNSTFVADAYYGWWFAGFAQRPTWSAVDPQYLSLSREFHIAQVATNLLDTDYLVDNNLTIQVREDGGYLARHNPEILTKLNWTYFPYLFFNFNSNQTKIKYDVNGNPQSVSLDKLPVKEMYMENDTQHVTISITKGNEFFNYTELTTVYQGLPFVNMTIKLEATAENVSLEWLQITVQSNGKPIAPERDNTVGLIDEGVKAFGQLIFKENLPNIDTEVFESSSRIHLEYNLESKSKGEIQISATTYSVTDDLQYYKDDETINNFFNPIITANLNSIPTPDDKPLAEPFNYQAELKINNISYVAVRDSEMIMKFAKDPTFSLVFINNEVSIFKVRASINQVRG